MILFQVTPAELIDVKFIKPKHNKILKIKMTQVFCQPRGRKLLVAQVGATTLLLMLSRGTWQNDRVQKSGMQVATCKWASKEIWFCPVCAEEHTIWQ